MLVMLLAGQGTLQPQTSKVIVDVFLHELLSRLPDCSIVCLFNREFASNIGIAFKVPEDVFG